MLIVLNYIANAVTWIFLQRYSMSDGCLSLCSCVLWPCSALHHVIKIFHRQFLNSPTWLCDIKGFEIRTPLSSSGEHWCRVSVLVFKYLTAKMSRGEGRGRNFKHTEEGGKNTRGGKLPACKRRKRTENFVRGEKKKISQLKSDNGNLVCHLW